MRFKHCLKYVKRLQTYYSQSIQPSFKIINSKYTNSSQKRYYNQQILIRNTHSLLFITSAIQSSSRNKPNINQHIYNPLYFQSVFHFSSINPPPTAIIIEKKAENESPDNGKIDSRVWPIALSSFFMGTGIGVIIPIMPSFASDIGLTTVEYGAVISVMGITRLLFNIPAAWASEKYGRRPLLVIGPILSSIGMALTAIAHTMQQLMSFRFITGAGGSIQMAGAQAYLSDISTAVNRTRTMAPVTAAFSAGAALGPVIGGFLADQYGVQIAFIFVGTAVGAVAINNYFLLPETKIMNNSITGERKSLWEEFLETLLQWRPIIGSLDNRSIFFVHTCFWFAQAGCTFTLMPLFATNVLQMSMSQIGIIFAMMSVINVMGSQPFAWVADKYGKKKVILPGYILCAGAIPFITQCSDAQQLTYLMVFYSVGACMMGTSPTAYMADMNSEKMRSQALALLRSGGDIGLMLGSGLLGYIAYIVDFSTAFNVGAAVLLLSGFNFTMRANESVIFHKK